MVTNVSTYNFDFFYITAIWRVRINHLGQSVDVALAVNGQLQAYAWCLHNNMRGSPCADSKATSQSRQLQQLSCC